MFTVLAALSGMEREYIRDRTLEGRESARSRGKGHRRRHCHRPTAMPSMALRLREQDLSLREIARPPRHHPGQEEWLAPLTRHRLLRDHDEQDPAKR
ncbi:hypothetical protein ACWDLG_39540 [Nonomuraea sp. NPDC003727]